MNKKLFKGVFQLKRTILVLHCMAVSESKARINFCDQISTKHNVSRISVLEHFPKGAENYLITEVEDERD